MDINNLIRFLIAWGPTILFVLIVGIAVLLGFIRGTRKSLILAINSLVIFSLCFAGYLFLINIKEIDEISFQVINKVLGFFNTSLGQLLNIGEANSLKEVLTLLLPEVVGYGDVLNSLLTDNGAYLNTIVNLSYNLIFAALMFIVYCFLDFIVYIIYLIFFNERRHYKKSKISYLNNAQAIIPQKRRLMGSFIGLVRGLCAGILTMGFVGSLFFIVGGDGNHDSVDVKFSDKNIDAAYTAFDAIGSYGDTGILKVLGSIKNKDDIPYYLLAFDLVVSGNYKDEYTNQTNNIIFRDELAAYTNLTRNTVKLLLKYDRNGDLIDIINGKSDLYAEDVILKIFADDGFNKEFKEVIDKFEAKTYLINLTLGLVNAIIVNIDSMNMEVSPEVKEIINILFNGENAIKVKDIVSTTDLKNILKMVLDVLALNYNSTDLEPEKYNVELVDIIIPYIKNLSLSSNQALFETKLNPLLSDCYGYLLTNSFKDIFDKASIKRAVKQTEDMNINWFKELNLIIDNFDKIYSFYNDVYLSFYEKYPESDDLTLFLDYIPSNQNYLAITNHMIDILSGSKVIAVFINETGVINNLKASLPSELSDNIPTKLELANVYDNNGYLVEFGELYNLLKSILEIACDQEAKEGLLELINYDFTTVNIDDIERIFAKFNSKIIDKLATSKFLSYAITGVLDDVELIENTTIFVPDDCVIIEQINDKQYRRLKKNELVKTFANLSDIIAIFKPYIETGLDVNDIENLINDYRLTNLINENKIFEGTFANILITQLSSVDELILVDNLNDPNLWIEYHEINNIINAINQSGINLSDILNGELSISTIKKWNLTHYSLNEILKSKLLKTNISYVITNTITDLVVPYNVLELSDETIDNVAVKQIKNEYIISLVNNIGLIFDDNEQIMIDSIIYNKHYLFNNPIIEASVTYHLFEAIKQNEFLIIPKKYENICDKNSLQKAENLIMNNREALNLLTALSDVLNIYTLDDLNNLTNEKISSKIFELNDYDYNSYPYRFKIDTCYKSLILSANITKVIDDNFSRNILKDEYKAYLKVDDIYQANDIRFFIDTLENFNIYNINDITVEALENLLFSSSYNIDILYQSRFVAYMLSSSLEYGLDGYIDTNIFSIISIKDGDMKKTIDKEEIKLLLDGLKTINIYSFDDLRNYDINTRYKELLEHDGYATKLYNLYRSTIIKGFITKQLDNIILSTNFLKVTDCAKEELANKVLVYKYIELESLLTGFKDLSLISLTDLNINNIYVYHIYSFLDSVIFRDAITNVLSNDLGFVLPQNTTLNNIITSDKLRELLNVLTSLGVNKIVDFNLNNIKIDLTFINNSYITSEILAYTLTKKLLEADYLLITNDLVESNYDYLDNVIYKIKYSDMYDLLLALYDFNIYDLNHFELIIPNQLYYSLRSQILLNTISKNLNININNKQIDIYVSNASSSVKQTLNNKDVRVLNDTEVSNLVAGLRLFSQNNFDVNFGLNSLKALDENSIRAILESEVLYHAISDLITSTGFVEGTISKEVYNLKTNEVVYKNYIDKESLITVIKYLPF